MQAEDLDDPGDMLVRRASPVRATLQAGALAAGSALAFLGAASAFGEEAHSGPTGVDQVVSLGMFSLYGPKYPGAERYGPFAYPTLNIRRPDEDFALASIDDGLSFAVVDTSRFKLGPVGALRQGRDAGTDARFAGLDRSPLTIEAGIFADWWILPERVRARAELRHGLRGHDGFALDLSADLFERAGRFTLAIGPRLGLLDAGLARIQFGVSEAAEARARAFASYTAHGGLQTVGLAGSIDYDWSSTWRSTLYARVDSLVGDAAASTITRRLGSEQQVTVGIGLTYSFRTEIPFLPGHLPD